MTLQVLPGTNVYHIVVHSIFDLTTPHLISIIATYFVITSAFNIDEEFPILISNKFNGENAHFGATVLLLPNLKSSASDLPDQKIGADDITGWVLIGAPKANSSSSNHSGINGPGVVWRCALGHRDINNSKTCEIVNVDPTGEYDPKDPKLPFSDLKDGGWLGGSMAVAESDYFVTCASRWINKKYTDLYLMNGICYWLPKTSLMTQNTDPNWPWLAPKLSYRLSPLLNGKNQAEKLKLNGTFQDKTVIYNWAYGQFGFSIHVTPQNELISGAPGIWDWSGGFVYYRDTLSPRQQFRRYNAHAAFSAFSEVVVLRAQNHGKVLHPSDYFGYSVTSGKFFDENVAKNKTQFVGGAPRASYLSGKVLIFTIEELQGGKSEGAIKLLVDPIEGKETKGHHYGSYFGHSLLALDVNGDGLDDLLVGAPLYGTSVRKKRNVNSDSKDDEEPANDEKNAKMKSGDEGCVFIYLSSGKDFVRSPQTICGGQAPGARFGYSITSLSDINFDGFNDVAVGAPYENEGKGAVYIYHGSKHFMTLAQKLKPERISNQMRTFGWSLSLGVDIDENGYPDLAVGAYETNEVVIFRTIPVVHLNANLTSSIPKLLSSTEDFNLTICISFDGPGRIPKVLGIWVNLTVEVETAEGKRLVALVQDEDSMMIRRVNSTFSTLSNRGPLLTTSQEKQLLFRSDGQSCYNFTVLRIGNVDGPARTVPVHLSYWLDGFNGSEATKPVHYVIERSISDESSPDVFSLNSTFEDFYREKFPISASNKIDTEKLILPVGTICESDGDPECLANLTINAYLMDYKSRKIYGNQESFLLGSAGTLSLTVELANHRETANLPISLSIKWTAPPEVRRIPPNCDQASIEYGEILVTCNVPKPLKETRREVFAIELGMNNFYGGPTDTIFNIQFEATTSSKMVNECKHGISVPLKTKLNPVDFTHFGPKMEYAPGNMSIPYFGLSQAFEISMEGPTSVSALEVDFDIPIGLDIEGQTYELVGVKPPIVNFDEDVVCHAINSSFFGEAKLHFPSNSTLEIEDITLENPSTDPIDVNHTYPDDDGINEVIKILWGKMRRTKREMFSEKASIESSLDGVLKLSCGTKNINHRLTCARISCTLPHFTPQKKAVIEFKLKLHKKAISELLGHENGNRIEDVSSVWIVTSGRTRALDVTGRPFGTEGKLEFTNRLGIPPPYELPAWILIGSIVGGLLLLTVITLILKQCGFFQRTKRDLLMEMRLKNIQSNIPNTSSTAPIRTLSSQRQNRYSNGNAGMSSSNVIKRKKSFQKDKNDSKVTTESTPIRSSFSQCGSPTTTAKQRDIPGAMDLNELRRLYDESDKLSFTSINLNEI